MKQTKKITRIILTTLVMLVGLGGILLTFINASAIKVAAIGDSITYGSGIANRDQNNYPSTLQHLLGIKYRVKNFGSSGRTAMWTGNKPYIEEQSYEDSLNFSPDIVVLMFGTNDSKAQNWIDKEAFKKQYRRLIQSYRTLETDPVVYLCTPATPYYINENTKGTMNFNIQQDKVNEIVEACKDLAEELEIELVNINEVTKGHPEWFTLDGIHPDANGAKAIAKAVYHTIKK
ncbi:GDSL-type esterase/lipase family protein [Priestia filamentosa]|uniref:GDSL-type esterase/lipase family protein n=1 Tax=Priestia filamentosa TaxID=1402861 RepID=UPI0039780CA1